MSFQITYKKLLDINLYHKYFLDDGATSFDANPTLKAEQLSKYEFDSFLKISPSEKTLKQFKGNKISLRKSSNGISLYISARETAPNSGIFNPNISLTQNTTITLLLYIVDYYFENYSTVSANPSIPYFFSNKKPTTEGGSFKYVDVEVTTTLIEDFSISQSTYDTLNEQLTRKEKIGLFGVIQLEMAGDDTTILDGNSRNILNTNGTLKNPHSVFKIQFLNRSTIWNYINPQDNSLIHTTDPTVFPLVKNGIIGYSFDSKERPSAQPNRLVFEKDGGGNIIKTISEIFIN